MGGLSCILVVSLSLSSWDKRSGCCLSYGHIYICVCVYVCVFVLRDGTVEADTSFDWTK